MKDNGVILQRRLALADKVIELLCRKGTQTYVQLLRETTEERVCLSDHRALDRCLQRLRQAGRIEYRRGPGGGWVRKGGVR